MGATQSKKHRKERKKRRSRSTVGITRSASADVIRGVTVTSPCPNCHAHSHNRVVSSFFCTHPYHQSFQPLGTDTSPKQFHNSFGGIPQSMRVDRSGVGYDPRYCSDSYDDDEQEVCSAFESYPSSRAALRDHRLSFSDSQRSMNEMDYKTQSHNASSMFDSSYEEGDHDRVGRPVQTLDYESDLEEPLFSEDLDIDRCTARVSSNLRGYQPLNTQRPRDLYPYDSSATSELSNAQSNELSNAQSNELSNAQSKLNTYVTKPPYANRTDSIVSTNYPTQPNTKQVENLVVTLSPKQQVSLTDLDDEEAIQARWKQNKLMANQLRALRQQIQAEESENVSPQYSPKSPSEEGSETESRNGSSRSFNQSSITPIEDGPQRQSSVTSNSSRKPSRNKFTKMKNYKYLDSHPVVSKLQNEQNTRLESMEKRMQVIKQNAEKDAARKKFAKIFPAKDDQQSKRDQMIQEAREHLEILKRKRHEKKQHKEQMLQFQKVLNTRLGNSINLNPHDFRQADGELNNQLYTSSNQLRPFANNLVFGEINLRSRGSLDTGDVVPVTMSAGLFESRETFPNPMTQMNRFDDTVVTKDQVKDRLGIWQYVDTERPVTWIILPFLILPLLLRLLLSLLIWAGSGRNNNNNSIGYKSNSPEARRSSNNFINSNSNNNDDSREGSSSRRSSKSSTHGANNMSFSAFRRNSRRLLRRHSSEDSNTHTANTY